MVKFEFRNSFGVSLAERLILWGKSIVTKHMVVDSGSSALLESEASVVQVWERLRQEAAEAKRREPALGDYFDHRILKHAAFEEALAYGLAQRLGRETTPNLTSEALFRQFKEFYATIQHDVAEGKSDAKDIIRIAKIDLLAVKERDPAVDNLSEPLLYFKGYLGLQAQRLANWLFKQGRRDFALYLQSRISEKCQMDIHPAVPIGQAVVFDHATGVVVGATAVIEDDVTILQGVTLGGNGKEKGDRHPKVRKGALIGAGARVLGNIEIGECARVAAGSVVLTNVPAHTTVAGVPAKVVRGAPPCDSLVKNMDHVTGLQPEEPAETIYNSLKTQGAGI